QERSTDTMARGFLSVAVLAAAFLFWGAASGGFGREGGGEPPGIRQSEKPMGLKAEAAAIEDELVKRHGTGERERIHRGIEGVAALWRESDGEFSAFVREHFIADRAVLDRT